MPSHRQIRSRDESHGDFDRRMMRRAINLARKGEGRVEPNPMVGCVVTQSDRVIGEGWHRRFGGHHAEVEALEACSGNPRGATVYISLEPCCHVGKTPPCTDALIQAGIRRVVIAMRDPHRHSGRCGVGVLQQAGIRVDMDAEKDAAAEVLAPYLTRVCLKRPYVIAKWAQSLDGKLATHTGQSRWISNETSRRLVHKLRARVDAILVGIRTVITDNPRLTARDVTLKRRAKRIIMDTQLRLPTRCRLVQSAQSVPTLVFTTADKAGSPRATRLRRCGVDVIPCRTKGGRISVKALVSRLVRDDVTNLLVEGGPTILTAFFEAGLVDEAHIFSAPLLIGGRDAPGPIEGRGATRVSHARRPLSMKTKRCGDDTLHVLRFTHPPLSQGRCQRQYPTDP